MILTELQDAVDSVDLFHYADDPFGHAGLLSHHVQESKLQSCLAALYRSMFGLKYRTMSDGRCRSTGDECLRSTVVSEYRSTGLVPGRRDLCLVDGG
ncbi:hypothetical protein F2Q69_00013741 [Brassica cretica]|uniref:Uncharacterized protein n=1 Tax=Brassica cretica TaxID=69181 RepID=A0A8S9QRT7_BRACR|nr:hypothetical protein F2Q69_00013741 [Brassica cretica]